MNFWQDLWNNPRGNRPLNSHGKSSLFGALDVCLAIELAVARFYSLNAEGFWDGIHEIVQSTPEKVGVLNELEKVLSNKIKFNCARLRPFRWEDLPDSNQGTNDNPLSIMEFLTSAPAPIFSGDFLGQIFQTWDSDGTKNSKGSYYTGENLARNLIQALELKTLTEKKDMVEVKKYQICDPACGSGVFFLELFRAICPSGTFMKMGQKLEIYGLDIDPVAVWICRWNLVIWQILQPAQAQNCVVLRDALHEDNKGTKQFNLILGNPPFFEVPASNYTELLNSYKTHRRINISALFVLKYAPLLKDGGQLGFIFPRAFLFSERWTFLRQFLSTGAYAIPRLILYNRGFPRVGLEQITLFLRRGMFPGDVAIVEYDDLKNLNRTSIWSIPREIMLQQPQFSLPLFSTPDVREILKIARQRSISLGTLCDTTPGTKEPAIFRGMGWERLLSLKKSSTSRLAIKGTDIHPFGVKQFRYVVSPSERTSVSGDPLRVQFIFKRPVVVCQRLVSSKTRVVAARLPSETVPISTLTCLCLPPPPPDVSALIVSVLNSTFASYYVADHVFLHSRLSTSLDKEYLRYFPIPNPEFLEQEQMHSLTDLTAHLETIARDSNDIFVIPEEMRQLDALIFQCYGLSESQGDILSQKLRAFWNKTRVPK